jgi:hypothetical protein
MDEGGSKGGASLSLSLSLREPGGGDFINGAPGRYV